MDLSYLRARKTLKWSLLLLVEITSLSFNSSSKNNSMILMSCSQLRCGTTFSSSTIWLSIYFKKFINHFVRPSRSWGSVVLVSWYIFFEIPLTICARSRLIIICLSIVISFLTCRIHCFSPSFRYWLCLVAVDVCLFRPIQDNIDVIRKLVSSLRNSCQEEISWKR